MKHVSDIPATTGGIVACNKLTTEDGEGEKIQEDPLSCQLVGEAGFEPATSRTRTVRAGQVALLPDARLLYCEPRALPTTCEGGAASARRASQ